MTIKEEAECIMNIQSYLDRIDYLETPLNLRPRGGGPLKHCNLCNVFERSAMKRKTLKEKCLDCPLGPELNGCGYHSQNHVNGSDTFIDEWYEASEIQLHTRMKWLLKQYKADGLDIGIYNA